MADTTSGTLRVLNPYDESVVGEIPLATEASVARILATAEQGYRANRRWPPWRRADFLEGAATRIEKEAEDWARLIAQEAGKPIRQARKEVSRATITLRLSAQACRRIAGETIPFGAYPGYDDWKGYFTREPLGIVVGITPSNDPLNLVAHKVGPALAAGNSIIIKPSELTPLTAFRFHGLLVECGMPVEFMTVLVGTMAANQAIIRARQVRMVSFTGGNAAAEVIVRDGGVKRYAMELGGNAPVIVCADAELDDAVDLCVSGAFWSNGQNCVGVQRIMVAKPRLMEFCDRFVHQVRNMRIGDPLDEETDIGPVVSDAHANYLCGLMDDAKLHDVRCLTGGRRKGRLIDPTVYFCTPPERRVWAQEAFGPLVNIVPFDGIQEAVAAANSSESLIHAAIFTNDLNKAHSASKALEAGGVIVNATTDFRFDDMPFGGFKYGSMGREGVRFAIEEMSQPKAFILRTKVSEVG